MKMGEARIAELNATVQGRDAVIVDVGNPQCVMPVSDFDFDWRRRRRRHGARSQVSQPHERVIYQAGGCEYDRGEVLGAGRGADEQLRHRFNGRGGRSAGTGYGNSAGFRANTRWYIGSSR